MNVEYTLYSDFNLEMHKKTFINYLEVIIHADGTVKYAIPSHQEYLIKFGASQSNLSREEFQDLCPKEYWCDYLTWLCMQTGCVVVWSCGYKAATVTAEQCSVLNDFIANNIMKNIVIR